MAANNRMVLLTSVTAGNDQDELNTAGLLVGELAINTNDGILFAGADPGGVGDGTTAKAAGAPVHNAADVLGIKLSTASTAQALGTGNSPTFAGLTIDSVTIGTIQTGSESFADNDTSVMTSAAVQDKITSYGYGTGSLSNLSEDSTPQLGGNLDTNSYNIIIDDAHYISDENNNEQLVFQTTASAVNYLEATNAATSGHPSFGATGSDSNIDLLLTAKGTGVVKADGVEVTTLTGTQTLTNKSLTSPAITGSLSGNAFLDEDNMASNSATKVASQQSIKAYVDSVAQGLYIHDAVVVATTAELNATYSNGTAGVGATLTNAGTQAALAIDGVTLTANERVLVKDQSTSSTQFENGIYQASTLGDGSSNWVLTRVTDFDTAADMKSGAFVFVQEGTANADLGFVMTQDASITVGTTAINWSQFSGAGQITAGTNLSKSGNTLSVDDAFLKNDANDTTTGTITAAGFTTTGSITLSAGAHSFNDIDIGSEFVDTDDHIMSSGAIKEKIESYSYGTGTMSNLSEDSSPQLGANLDTNSYNILIDDAHFLADESGNEQIVFQTTGSAVNYLEATNAATGNAPSFAANGDDANIDLTLAGKGTGGVKLTTNSTRHILFDFDGATTNKTHTIVSSHTDNRTLTLADGNTTLVAGTMITTGSTVGDLTDSTSAAIGIGTIELGHANDTTIARASSGVISVEGSNVIMASNNVSALTDSTSAAIGIGTVELGHANDTTLSRSAAGKLAVEGVDVCLLSGAQTLAAKTISGGTF